MFDLNEMNNKLKNIYAVNSYYNLYDLICIIIEKINEELANTPDDDYERRKKLLDDSKYIFNRLAMIQTKATTRIGPLAIHISSFLKQIERLKEKYEIPDIQTVLTEEEMKKRKESFELIKEMMHNEIMDNDKYINERIELYSKRRKREITVDECNQRAHESLNKQTYARHKHRIF